MSTVLDILGFAVMLFLRVGVPILLMAGAAYVLKRLDRRWEAEARAAAQQRAEAGLEEVRPAAEAPAAPKQKRAPVKPPVIPWVPPPAVERERPQPGLAMAQVAQPCWDVKGCTEEAKAECAAPQNPNMPCWQARFNAEGHIPEECVNCDIFQRYPVM